MNSGAFRVAVTGKGGGGKTAFAAIATDPLSEGGRRSIPAIGLLR